jgi:hypothetical protein
MLGPESSLAQAPEKVNGVPGPEAHRVERGPLSLGARRTRLAAWLPIPVFVILVVVLSALPLDVVFEPRLLLPALNGVFLTAVPLLVAWLAVRSYVSGGPLAVLLLGGGMLAFGIAGGLAGLMVPLQMGGNETLTFHNLGALVAGLLCFASALLASGAPLAADAGRRGWGTVAAVCLGVGLMYVVLAVGLVRGDLPPLFVDGEGPTPLRQAVLGAAILLFAVSAALFKPLASRSGSGLFEWFVLALLLIAVGLTGVAL